MFHERLNAEYNKKVKNLITSLKDYIGKILLPFNLKSPLVIVGRENTFMSSVDRLKKEMYRQFV